MFELCSNLSILLHVVFSDSCKRAITSSIFVITDAFGASALHNSVSMLYILTNIMKHTKYLFKLFIFIPNLVYYINMLIARESFTVTLTFDGTDPSFCTNLFDH